MNVFNAENLYYLGPEGTYAQRAMQIFVKDCGINVKNIIPLNPITAILKSIDKDENSIAVLPIENSIEGIVRETIDNIAKLTDKKIKIAAETVIPINHCLMSDSENFTEIHSILSHTQALGQCSGYICENFSGVNIIETTSTSEAAKSAKERGKGYAAIASENAANIFGLNILAHKINDEKDNKTRFILLSRNEQPKTTCDKTSIFFAIKNEPGSLFQVLSIFNEYNINLLYIDSRPSKKQMGEYTFCIDIEGHKNSSKIEEALKLIKNNTNSLIVLGSYPRFKD